MNDMNYKHIGDFSSSISIIYGLKCKTHAPWWFDPPQNVYNEFYGLLLSSSPK